MHIFDVKNMIPVFSIIFLCLCCLVIVFVEVETYFKNTISTFYREHIKNAVAFWTMLLTGITLLLYFSASKELSLIKKSNNDEVVQKMSNDFYSKPIVNDLIMLAENDLLTFDTTHMEFKDIPRTFPIFTIKEDSFPGIILCLRDSTHFHRDSKSKKMFYTTYDIDDVLAPLDRVGGFFRNGLIEMKDLSLFFKWPSVMFGKNKAIHDYFIWLKYAYPNKLDRTNNGHDTIEYGLHYYDLRIMIDTLSKYTPSEKEGFYVSKDTSAALNLK